MRRLIRLAEVCLLTATLLATVGCRREEKIKLEPTDESQSQLLSTVNAADPKAAMQLTKGFHAVEQNAWRWTMGRFAVTLQPPAGAAERGATLTVRLAVPEPALQKLKKMTLAASVQNTPIGSQTFTTAGEHTFRGEVAAALMKADATTVEFSLDPFLPAGSLDGRELGIIFVSASLESK